MTRKKKDRTLNYLVKIDKEVGDLRKEVSDIRKMMESSKMIKDSDEMYSQTFINVSILFIYFILFIFIKKNYFTDNIFLKKKIIGEIANKTISEKIYPDSKKLKQISAKFLINKYPELFKDWGDKRWTFYYDLILQKKVSFTEYIIIQISQ